MNLREEILKEHSKVQCEKIIAWVGTLQGRFDELFYLFIKDIPVVTQRAGWPMGECAIAHPVFMKKHFKELLDNVEKPALHNAVKRNTVRLLQDIDIPEKFHGRVMDICFRFLEAPTEHLAVKVFSMTVLHNLSKAYPEIFPELKLIIEEQLPRQTVGFKSRARKVLGVKGV